MYFFKKTEKKNTKKLTVAVYCEIKEKVCFLRFLQGA